MWGVPIRRGSAIHVHVLQGVLIGECMVLKPPVDLGVGGPNYRGIPPYDVSDGPQWAFSK